MEGSRIAVGSLPATDPVSAVRSQFQAFPEMPAWPQLPKRSPKERMDRQGLMGLKGLIWPSPDQPIFALSAEDNAEAWEELREDNREDRLDRAAFRPEEAAGFFTFLKTAADQNLSGVRAVKGQSIGPVSLGAGLLDERGRPLLSSREGMKVLTEYLLLHCRWQARKLSTLGKQVVLFLDEPFLNGKFKPEEYGLQRKDVQAFLSGILEALQEEGFLTGLHCCGPGPWDLLFESPVEIIHFDAFRYLPQVLEDPRPLKAFLRKGGMIAWGIAPTWTPQGRYPDPAELFHLWTDHMDALAAKGLPHEDLVSRSLFSTSCGLGNSLPSVAEEAIRGLGTFVSLWRANVTHA